MWWYPGIPVQSSLSPSLSLQYAHLTSALVCDVSDGHRTQKVSADFTIRQSQWLDGWDLGTSWAAWGSGPRGMRSWSLQVRTQQLTPLVMADYRRRLFHCGCSEVSRKQISGYRLWVNWITLKYNLVLELIYFDDKNIQKFSPHCQSSSLTSAPRCDPSSILILFSISNRSSLVLAFWMLGKLSFGLSGMLSVRGGGARRERRVSWPGLGEVSTPESVLDTEPGPAPQPSPRDVRLVPEPGLPDEGLPDEGLPLPCLNNCWLLQLEPGLRSSEMFEGQNTRAQYSILCCAVNCIGPSSILLFVFPILQLQLSNIESTEYTNLQNSIRQ